MAASRGQQLDAWAIDTLLAQEVSKRIEDVVTHAFGPLSAQRWRLLLACVATACVSAAPLVLAGRTTGQHALGLNWVRGKDAAPRHRLLLLAALCVVARLASSDELPEAVMELAPAHARSAVRAFLRNTVTAWQVLEAVCFLAGLRQGHGFAVAERLAGTSMSTDMQVSDPQAPTQDGREKPLSFGLMYTYVLMSALGSTATFARQHAWPVLVRAVMHARACVRAVWRRRQLQPPVPSGHTHALTHTDAARAWREMQVPCTWCGIQPPTHPTRAACTHVFCYVCLRAASASRDACVCPACDAPVAAP